MGTPHFIPHTHILLYVEVYPLNTQHGRVGNRFDRLAYLGSICLVNTAVLLRRKTVIRMRNAQSTIVSCRLFVVPLYGPIVSLLLRLSMGLLVKMSLWHWQQIMAVSIYLIPNCLHVRCIFQSCYPSSNWCRSFIPQHGGLYPCALLLWCHKCTSTCGTISPPITS